MLKKILFTICLTIVLLSLGAQVVEAYSLDESYRPVNSPFDIDYDANDPAFNTIIILQILAGALLYFATPVAIIFIALAGFKMVTGGSESEQLDEAKKSLTWSVLGLVAIMLSYSAVRFVISLVIRSAEAI